MLHLSYIALTIVTIALLVYFASYSLSKTITSKSKAQKKVSLVIVGMLIWQIYIFSIAYSGFLEDFSLPPRMPICMIIPPFLFTALFIANQRKKPWIQAIPPHWLVFYQTFRIVLEILFVFTVARGILPERVTIEGYNFDMIYACTAIIIGFLLMKNAQKYRTLGIVWNYLGLAVIASIIFLFVTTAYFPSVWSDKQSIPTDFGTYPYQIVPAFLMPSAVFIHVLSIVQLRSLNRKA